MAVPGEKWQLGRTFRKDYRRHKTWSREAQDRIQIKPNATGVLFVTFPTDRHATKADMREVSDPEPAARIQHHTFNSLHCLSSLTSETRQAR